MEDRYTPTLYVELGNMDASEYESTRAPKLLGQPGAERVTWWRTLVPGRSELPMEIPDGTLLGVVEVLENAEGTGLTFEPPGGGALPRFTSHLFHRYRRPGQGILTGRPTTGLLVVWISPQTPEQYQALRDWGDFVHIRHIAAAGLPGFTRITVYENADPEPDLAPQFMHFYELDTDDTEGAYGSMARLVAPRLGGFRSEEFKHWADYRAAGGRLIYCNTFELIGSLGDDSGSSETAAMSNDSPQLSAR